ncbi:MAG: MASE1 domain-containing protein [Pedobacter sp.]
MKTSPRNIQLSLLQNSAVALAYLLTAKLGFLLALEHTNATAVWPPTGIALAACLLFGFHIWPGIFFGAFLANILVIATGSFPSLSALLVSLSTASGNSLEALTGAYLVKRFISGIHPFDRTQDTLCFILLGAFASPVISATIGTASFCIYGDDWSRSGQMWLTWWLGDAVGALIFAPLLLSWKKRGTLSWDKKKMGEATILLAMFLLVEVIVFRLNFPLEYLIFPILFWTAFRFGQFETAVTVALVMVTFLLWTVKGFGPFAGKTFNYALLFLQSYLGVASASTLILSTLISARKHAEDRLREYQGNLEKLVRARTAELQEANERLRQEIEDRARAEQMFTEREAQYRDLVESANCVILRWLPDGRITFFNRFAQIFFGYSEEEIINRNIIGTVVPTEDSTGHELTSLVEGIVTHPEAYVRNENENIRKNGERVWVAWTNKPILNADGSIAEILSIGVDITKLVHTERELRRTLDELAIAKELAETADQIKSAFLATMSHELRTPLNSIIGFTGILLQGLGGPINDEQAKQLNMVKNSANHLLSLISDVLDISKIEAGQLTVNCEPLDLKASIFKVVQLVRPMAEKKGIYLNFDVAKDVGIASADERRVEQVLLNLLSNAVKFTEQGGISVRCLREAECYVTTVTDTGIGIKGDDLEYLFKPFYQVDNGLNRKYEGTGLGLSICKKMVELMGGSIRVESSKGKGSIFSFTLPLERNPV